MAHDVRYVNDCGARCLDERAAALLAPSGAVRPSRGLGVACSVERREVFCGEHDIDASEVVSKLAVVRAPRITELTAGCAFNQVNEIRDID